VDQAQAYLDYNATAPLRPQARAAMVAALEQTGNPSSVHGPGRAARRVLEEAREAVARLAGARPAEVVFTSGGSEANTLALAPGKSDGVLLVGASEHPSVLAGGRFPASTVETIPVDQNGLIALDWLAERLRRAPAVTCVSVMAANNETGVIQPIERIAELSRATGAVLHCDAVQAAGRVPLDALDGVDLITLSAHKIGGPQGVGALIRRGELPVQPLVRGGGQERAQRAGTENVAGIAGFGAVADQAIDEAARTERLTRLRDRLEEELRAISPDAVIFSQGAARVANTTCFAVPGIAAEKAVIALDLDGVAVSSGSACSSGKVGPSHVLAAMGVEPHLAGGAIRVSLGWASSEGDIEMFLRVWRRVAGALDRNRREQAA
jgi:cysteine desulfurase